MSGPDPISARSQGNDSRGLGSNETVNAVKRDPVAPGLPPQLQEQSIGALFQPYRCINGRLAELASKCRVARAAFFETRGGKCGGGRSWGLRLWNGFGEQMTTVFLPSPFLSEDLKVLKEPRWERLRLW